MYASIFFTVSYSCTIFASLFNSFVLGNFKPSTLFVIDAIVSVIPVVVYGFLPDPILPENYQAKKLNFSESFASLIKMIQDTRVHRMTGLFFNSAVASAIS